MVCGNSPSQKHSLPTRKYSKTSIGDVAACLNVSSDSWPCGLEISDVNWLMSLHKQDTTPAEQNTRFLDYPALPLDTDYNVEEDIRAGAHSDYRCITFLFQRPSQSGLEILTPQGPWASVPCHPTQLPLINLPPYPGRHRRFAVILDKWCLEIHGASSHSCQLFSCRAKWSTQTETI